ncbi:hypothetical protein [Vibrio phage Va2]|nr:hypothetical protein [Vibrio phage Va2]
MSTDHTLLESGGNTELLTLLESSCDFTLYHDSKCNDTGMVAIKRDMSLDEVKELNQRLSQIISYYDPDYEGTKV